MKKYKIIYADPPWSYENKSLNRGGAEKHYSTMSIDEICDLPVKDISDDDCVLFLWTTFPQINCALKLINCWGFEYKTNAFTWIKKNKLSGTNFWGMGSWTRSNAEICLLAIKGKPKRYSKSIHSVIESPIMKHSKKPDIVRDKIVELAGDLPRIELFSRQKVDGWDHFGNEIGGGIELWKS